MPQVGIWIVVCLASSLASLPRKKAEDNFSSLRSAMFILLGHALDSEFQVPLNSPPSCLAPFSLDMLFVYQTPDISTHTELLLRLL